MTSTRQTDTSLVVEKQRDKVVPSPVTKIQEEILQLRRLYGVPNDRLCAMNKRKLPGSVSKYYIKNIFDCRD
jgi:hypothetical protein